VEWFDDWPDGRVMDGMHRIARALVEQRKAIGAVRLPGPAAADDLSCRPQDLRTTVVRPSLKQNGASVHEVEAPSVRVPLRREARSQRQCPTSCPSPCWR
jgi:hypothetical protein